MFNRILRFRKEMLRLNYPVKYLSFLVFIYFVGWGIVLPILPIFIKKSISKYAYVGIIFAVPHIFGLFWSLFLGKVLDKIPKRAFISSVLLLYSPMSPILFALKGLFSWIVFQVYHAVAAVSFWLTTEAYLREHSRKNKESESIGLYDFATGSAQVVGGIICAITVAYFEFKILYAVSLFAFFALVISFFLPDHRRKLWLNLKKSLKSNTIKNEIKDSVTDKGLRDLFICSFPFFICISFLPMVIPLFAASLDGELSTIGALYAFFYVPKMFESYFSTIKYKHALKIGLIMCTVFFTLIFFIKDMKVIFLLTLLLGLGFASVKPLIFGSMTKLMPKTKRGELSAVAYAVRSFAGVISPIVAGIVADTLGINYVFLLGALMMVSILAYQKFVAKSE